MARLRSSRISSQPTRWIGLLRLRAIVALTLTVLLSLPLTPGAFAQEKGVGKLGAIIGKALIIRDGQKIPAKKGMEVFPSDVLQTAEKAVVKISFDDGGSFMAFESSAIKIEEYDVKRQGEQVSLKSAFNIAKGKVRFFVKPGENRKNDAAYKTENAVMGIRGTSGFIDTTGGKTRLVVTTGKVEVSNPRIPGQSVMVPANFMTDVVGNGAPSVPKEAPAELLQGLNSSAQSADATPDSDSAQPGDEGVSEPGSSSDEAAPEGEAPQEESPATEPRGEGATERDAQEQGQTDGAPTEDSEERSASREENRPRAAASAESEANSDSDSDDSATPSRRDARKSETGLANQTDEKEGNANRGQGQRGRTVRPASAQSEKGSEPGPSNRAPAAEQAPAQAAPRIERVTVFTEDGSSSVSVSDTSLSSLATKVDSGIAPVGTTLGARQSVSSTATPSTTVVQQEALRSATTEAIKQVDAVNETTKAVQDEIETSVQQAIQTTTAAKEAAAPTSRAVKVRVILPGQ